MPIMHFIREYSPIHLYYNLNPSPTQLQTQYWCEYNKPKIAKANLYLFLIRESLISHYFPKVMVKATGYLAAPGPASASVNASSGGMGNGSGNGKGGFSLPPPPSGRSLLD